MDGPLYQEENLTSSITVSQPLRMNSLNFIQHQIANICPNPNKNDILSAYQPLLTLLQEIKVQSSFNAYFEDITTRDHFLGIFLRETVNNIKKFISLKNDVGDTLNLCIRKIVILWAEVLSKMNSGIVVDDNRVYLDHFTDLILYSIQQDILNFEDLQRLWQAKQHYLRRLHKMRLGLSDSKNNTLKASFVEYVITDALNLLIDEITAYECDLIFQVYYTCEYSEHLFRKFCDLHWYVLNSDPIPPWMIEYFLSNISRLTKAPETTSENKMQLFSKCIESFENRTSVVLIFRVIKRILESYPKMSAHNNELTQGDCINHLCEEKGLLRVILEEFKVFIETNLENLSDPTLHSNYSVYGHFFERVGFIKFLLVFTPGCGKIVTYEVLKGLWEICVTYSNIGSIQMNILMLLRTIIESRNGLDIRIDDLIKFMKENMNMTNFVISIKAVKEGIECFRSLFVAVNESLNNISEALIMKRDDSVLLRFGILEIIDKSVIEEDGDFEFEVNTIPNKMEGFGTLWSLALLPAEASVTKKTEDLLVALYTSLGPQISSQALEIRQEYVDLCFKSISQGISEKVDNEMILKGLTLINKIIDIIDRDNPIPQKLHCELSKGYEIEVNIKHGSTNRLRIVYISAHSNTLVKEFFSNIAGQLNVSADNIYLVTNTEIPGLKASNSQKTRTFSDVGIKHKSTLCLELRIPPKLPLVLDGKTFHPQVKEIVMKFFEENSENHKMSPDGMTILIEALAGSRCRPTDYRVQYLFKQFDHDRDGYLNLAEYLEYWLDLCNKEPYTAWNKILEDERRKILINRRKVRSFSAHINQIIISNPEYMDMLFSLIEVEDENVAKSAFQLLNRLPTYPQVFADIVMLRGVRGISDRTKRDWKYVLDASSKYRLQYCLDIIECLIDYSRLDKEKERIITQLLSYDTRLPDYQKTWKADFAAFGGLQQSISIINNPSLGSNKPRVAFLIAVIKNEKTNL